MIGRELAQKRLAAERVKRSYVLCYRGVGEPRSAWTRASCA
jgi:hypothetical protein